MPGGKLEGASGSKLEGDSGSKLACDSASKLEGDSASKLEGALLLGTRCHCMNTSSENKKSFCVCLLDVTCQGVNLHVILPVNLKVPLAGNLKVTLAVAVNLKVNLAVNSASKLEGDSGSKLEGALLLCTRCHCMNTSSENIKSFCVCQLDVTH